MQELGHKVTIFTSHCDKTHCFEEVRDGSLDVRVRGNTIFPHSILSRFSILCAILRQLHLVLQITVFTKELKKLDPEILFIDQLSACIPLLREQCPNPRILFYCHFPDKLLASRRGWIRRLYRWPFDWLESWSTGASDVIAVNSNFTKSVFAQAFPMLSHRSPRILYPCVDVEASEAANEIPKNGETPNAWTDKKLFLSINRFERKKEIGLAIRAFASIPEDVRKQSRLVLAGGYDPRIGENVSYHAELERLASSYKLKHATFKNAITTMSSPPDVEVIFLLSIPTALKATLLRSCAILLYTPAFEHFGIVPLEAMLAEKPVLAANVGGPTETVVDNETGWLKNPDNATEWAEVMQLALADSSQPKLLEMGRKGKQRVTDTFSKRQMAQRLNAIFEKMLAAKTRPVIMEDREILILLGIVLAVGFIGVASGALVLSHYVARKHYMDEAMKNIV